MDVKKEKEKLDKCEPSSFEDLASEFVIIINIIIISIFLYNT